MRIVSFGQQVLLDEEMTVINQITVELQDGNQVSVPASEETVQALMKLHAGLPVETEVYQPSLPALEPEIDEEFHRSLPDEVYDDPGEMTDAVMGTLAERPVDAVSGPPRAIGQPQPRPTPRIDADGFALSPKAKTVPKNAMGYPIVQQKAQPQQPQQRQLVVDEDGEQI